MERTLDYVIRHHGSMVLAYLYAIVRDRDLAEDLLQETFLAACRQGPRLDAVTNMPGWLRTVARHRAFRALRQRNAARLADWRDATDDGLFHLADEPPAPDLADLRQFLRQCRERLPDQQRRIVELFYDERMPAESVAQGLGLSIKTVYQTLWRARDNLRECIERHVRKDEALL